jgi:hypothetical protein
MPLRLAAGKAGTITRRDFLAWMAIAAGATALGCTDSSGPDPDPGR